MLTSNKTIRLSNFSSKIPKEGIFGLKFRHFLTFCKNLKIDQFQGVDFDYDNIFIKFLLKNAQKSHYLAIILAIIVFSRILENDKFEGVAFKYNNNFMKIIVQKYSNKPCLVSNLHNIVFSKILQLDKFNGFDFKYDNSFFKFLPKNTQLRERGQLGFVTLNSDLAVNLNPPLLNGNGQFTFLKTKSSHSSGIVRYPPKFEFLKN